MRGISAACACIGGRGGAHGPDAWGAAAVVLARGEKLRRQWAVEISCDATYGPSLRGWVLFCEKWHDGRDQNFMPGHGGALGACSPGTFMRELWPQ